MDNNLPPSNDNQKSDNLNINPPKPPVAPTPTPPEPTIPPMPEIPSTPPPPPPKPLEPEENINIPEPEQKPEEPKPEEKPIEIGSLGNPSSFTSYAQEETSSNSPKSANKGKKVKTIASVLGLLLIIAALPLTMILVKQRQEIRKEAATGTFTACGVTVSASGDNWNGSSYTGSYSLKNNSTRTVQMKIHLYGCACNDGDLGKCGTNSGDCDSKEDNFSIGAGKTTTKSITTPSKNDCGTFQTDLFVMSCSQQ